MSVIHLNDKGRIEAFLRKNVYLHIYSIGDLDDFFWPDTTWYGWEERGEIQAIVLLYTASADPTVLALSEQQETPPLIVSGLGNGLLFDQLGLRNHRDLNWQESTHLGDVEIVFTECRHRSGRGAGDQMKTLWGSFVLKSSAGNIYFAGDTGYGPHLKEAGEEYGPFRLALLPIGAYEPRWFMADVHLNPDEAVRAHLELRSERSIGMHFGTFQLTYEGIDKPLLELDAARKNYGISSAQFEVLDVGETSTFGLPLQTAGNP